MLSLVLDLGKVIQIGIILGLRYTNKIGGNFYEELIEVARKNIVEQKVE
jgi:hypothetical protein